MSIATMMRLAAQAEAGGPAPPQRGPRPAGGPIGQPPVEPGPAPEIGGAPISSGSNVSSRAQAALEAIAGYIPSEALALYIGALGAFQPATDASKWIVLGAGVALVILFAGWNAADRATRPAPRKIAVVVVLAVVSFVTYAAALPGSPFISVWAQAPVAAGYVAVALSVLLPRFAVLAKVAPQTAT
jgi:hypothetical protein